MMGKKAIIRASMILVLLYPVYRLFRSGEIIDSSEVEIAENALLNFQASVWITWVVWVSLAIYFKWTEKGNVFFYATYGFLAVAFAVLGYLHQSMVNTHDLPTPFEDTYTLGVLIALQNLLTSCILTAFLQAGVWWFTRRWHRR